MSNMSYTRTSMATFSSFCLLCPSSYVLFPDFYGNLFSSLPVRPPMSTFYSSILYTVVATRQSNTFPPSLLDHPSAVYPAYTPPAHIQAGIYTSNWRKRKQSLAAPCPVQLCNALYTHTWGLGTKRLVPLVPLVLLINGQRKLFLG